MQPHTMNVLLEAFAPATSRSMDAHNRITALERTLRKQKPALYADYMATLDQVKHDPASSLPESEVADLRAKLLRDRD